MKIVEDNLIVFGILMFCRIISHAILLFRNVHRNLLDGRIEVRLKQDTRFEIEWVLPKMDFCMSNEWFQNYKQVAK